MIIKNIITFSYLKDILLSFLNINFIDEKQEFYNGVLDGSIPYQSYLINIEEKTK